MHLYTSHLLMQLLPFVYLADAHVKVVQPVPYGAASLNTNPLEQSGADWPCKLRAGAFDITKWNVMPIDSPQTIKFQGQATHGGGSCQISLTRDTPPNKDSIFKVIKSIEGGCPSMNPGNVGTDPFGYGADSFDFTVPDVISPANYTLAWTWFNKIGNSEMYMNCLPVTVTKAGATKHRRHRPLRYRADGMDSLPDMFRANSGNGCSTAQSGTVLKIPGQNLGKNVQRIGSDPLTPPVGNCGGTAAAPAEPPASGEGSASPVQSSGQVSSATPPSTPQTSAQSSQGGVQITPLSMVSNSSAATQAPTYTAAAPPVSVSPAAIPQVPGTTMGTCPSPGKSLCSPDGKAWGTCMQDHQVYFQAIAPGTKCDPALGVEVPADAPPDAPM
ncbi:hypothetical protein ACLMJK_003300 [Lecanora helva]